MPGRFPRFFFVALAVVLSGAAFAEEPTQPCSTQGDMKSPAWRASCDDAIARTTNAKVLASLRYGRAYAAVEAYRYDDALRDLDAALNAWPDNPDYLRERAYVHVELSNFGPAIVDLDRVLQLEPKNVLGYRERGYVRHFTGNLQGAYEDRAREFELTPKSPDALLARGIAALWLGKFDDAKADVKGARKLGKAAGKENVLRNADGWLTDIELWRHATGRGDATKLCSDDRVPDKGSEKTIIGDCTKAFLEAKTGVARADALTTRSMAWLVITGDQKHSTEDLAVAKAFDPENVRRPINLGYSYLHSNHSWAANREFERALELEHNPYALAGRAAARKNLGDKDGALADAVASNELEPNEAATGVLADLAYERGDKDQARELYQLLYERGSRSDEITERLRELGVPK